MALRLFDTYAREIREFVPLQADLVRLYACGPTVYDYAHIGNLRTYIFEDVLRRVLELNGYRVEHVLNITDVGHLVSDADSGEDKMVAGAKRTGKSAWEIADFYARAFKTDFRLLNILEPDIWCRATEHIGEMIDAIRCIESNGYTYATSDGIYFDTGKLDDYGHLARLDVEGLEEGARVEMGEKRLATDFALWKFSPPDEQRQMEWDSPWGKGFPGWHIECSTMSAKYLGTFLDIHCGGEDHIPVHHCNEIAQAQACYGTRLANYWMHGYFLMYDDSRMAKSSGAFIRVSRLIELGYDPLAYRYLCLTAHYRSHLRFSWDSLRGAETALQRLRNVFDQWPAPERADEGFVARFLDCVNDDLNTARALALTWELVRSDLPPGTKKATVLLFDEVLGLNLSASRPGELAVPDDVEALVAERETARRQGRWSVADSLRERVRELGFEIEDTPDGPRVVGRSSTDIT